MLLEPNEMNIELIPIDQKVLRNLKLILHNIEIGTKIKELLIPKSFRNDNSSTPDSKYLRDIPIDIPEIKFNLKEGKYHYVEEVYIELIKSYIYILEKRNLLTPSTVDLAKQSSQYITNIFTRNFLGICLNKQIINNLVFEKKTEMAEDGIDFHDKHLFKNGKLSLFEKLFIKKLMMNSKRVIPVIKYLLDCEKEEALESNSKKDSLKIDFDLLDRKNYHDIKIFLLWPTSESVEN